LLLHDALAARPFARALLEALATGATFPGSSGTIVARPVAGSDALRLADLSLEPAVARADHSNTAVVFGDQLLFKPYRRPGTGLNPDVELTECLTRRRFPNVPALGAVLEHHGPEGSRSLGILTQFISGATDGWKYTVDALGRYIDRALLYV